MKNLRISEIALRFGLAFVFLYAGINGLINPSGWIGYLPDFIRNLSLAPQFLTVFSIAEILLGLWLLWGYKLSYVASISAFMLLGITFANTAIFEIVFRDVGLFFMAVALVFFAKTKDIANP